MVHIQISRHAYIYTKLLHAFNPSTGEAEAGRTEFEASLVYRASSMTVVRVTQKNPVSNNKSRFISLHPHRRPQAEVSQASLKLGGFLALKKGSMAVSCSSIVGPLTGERAPEPLAGEWPTEELAS